MVVQMLPYRSLIIIHRRSETAVYIQIANRLIRLIQHGLLQPGHALPSIRVLAGLIKVHPKTIVAAYEEMVAQDWLVAVPKKGVFVSHKLPHIKPRVAPKLQVAAKGGAPAKAPRHKVSDHRFIIDDGFPDPRIAPVDVLFREYRRLYEDKALQRKAVVGDLAGAFTLRLAISRFLSETRGLPSKPENIFVTRGAQMGLYILSRSLLKRGSTVVVAEPNYPFANKLFQECGARLIKINMEHDGLDVDRIDSVCRRRRPDLVYVVPHHHHPTTVTLSAEKRMRLLTTVQHHDLTVIEDDYDYDFHYNSSPILPLASHDHNGRIIYIGSISKSFTNALRMGFFSASPELIRRIGAFRQLIDIRGDSYLEEAVASLYRRGDMQRHLKKSVRLYRERRDCFYDTLQTELGEFIELAKPAGGMAFWLTFRKRFPLARIAANASALNLLMSDGSFYNTGTKNYNALRAGFASLDMDEIQEVSHILKKAVRTSL